MAGVWIHSYHVPEDSDDYDADDQDAPVHYNCVPWELESDRLYLNSIYPLSFPIDLSIPSIFLCPNCLGFLNPNSTTQQYYCTSRNHNCVLPLFS
jgi:hypothetical protein